MSERNSTYSNVRHNHATSAFLATVATCSIITFCAIMAFIAYSMVMDVVEFFALIVSFLA